MGNRVSLKRLPSPGSSGDFSGGDDSRRVWRNPNSEDDVCAVLFADGSCFYGPYRSDKCQGFGIKISPDGTEIEGYWKHDVLEGKALVIRADGSQYICNYTEGEWKSEFRVSNVPARPKLVRTAKSSSASLTPSSSCDDIQRWLSEGHLGSRPTPRITEDRKRMSFGHRSRLMIASYNSTTPPLASTSSTSARVYVPRPPSRVDTWLIPFDQLILLQRLSAPNRCPECSVVYKGTWLGKEVVIRVFRNVQSVEGQCSELLTKMARIRHPNIALFMAAAVSENKLAIVTEYVSNGNVGGLNLTSQNLLHLAKGIAVGCAYLRKQGFAHKNLKPSNVLIDSGIDVKLTDYFVKEFNELFHPSFNCQSEPVAYLGPEALRQTPFVPFGIDSASDVFAFGMICWEMLTARQPYLGLSRAQIRVLVGYAGYRESRLSCGTLRGLARLIEKCTAQEPPMRPTFERVILAISALHSSANSAAEDALITFISGR